MVDFDTNALVLRAAGIKVAAASVDSVESSKSLNDGMRLRYVQMFGEIDALAIAEATGANLQTGDRTFLHATGFLVNPDGVLVQSVYASGPIGRFVANDILKVVEFAKVQAAAN